MSIVDLRERLAVLSVEHEQANRAFRSERQALVDAEDFLTDCEEAQKILQLVAQTVQQKAHERIAGVVSRCLEAVFEEPYDFKIQFEQKRGRTEATLVFERDGMTIDPLTASGGGVVDVAAFALRLSCLLLVRPALRRVIIMDEPFRFVSVDYRGRVRKLLEKLAEDLKVQLVLVTHMEELRTGTVLELG